MVNTEQGFNLNPNFYLSMTKTFWLKIGQVFLVGL